MSSEFYDLYKSYEQHELFEVLLHPDDYQPEAVECAKQVLREKRWQADYQKLLEEQKTEQEQEAEEEQEDNLEKAEYFRKAVEIKMQHHLYSVLLGDTEKFEERLAALKLDYFKEDQTLSRQSYNPDFQLYYFKTEDTDTVDAIGKELGIFNNVYDSAQAQGKSQMKFLGIILIGFAVVFGLYALFKK